MRKQIKVETFFPFLAVHVVKMWAIGEVRKTISSYLVRPESHSTFWSVYGPADRYFHSKRDLIHARFLLYYAFAASFAALLSGHSIN